MSNKMRITLIILFLGVFCLSGVMLLQYHGESVEAQKEYDELAQLVEQVQQETYATEPDWDSYRGMDDEEILKLPESPFEVVEDPDTGKEIPILPELQPLYEINPDLVGWIRVPDTVIDYPVVQRKEQKDYYLRRNFRGKHETRGCLYVAERCDVEKPSDNVTIYGHMMSDGTMFADLAKYRSKSFWEEHQYFSFNTLKSRETYRVICVFKTSGYVNVGFPYHAFVDAADPVEFRDFWNACSNLALYDTGVSAVYGDKLLCLSTCDYSIRNGRLVVVAKRVEH